MRLPEEFRERMRTMLGDEYADFETSMDKSPVFTGLRINTLKEGAAEALIRTLNYPKRVPWCESGFYTDKTRISGNHPYHLAGLFYFQEPSAMSAAEALPVCRDDRVLDLCAAPGGKATRLGEKLGGSGILVANEIIKSRAAVLSDNIARFGITNAVVTNETPQRLAERFPCFFDKIIVDAPCSGEGMFRKEPRAADEWSVEHTLSCAARQKHILDCAMRMLRGGGYLVYSTCTFAPEENERVCAYLLDRYNVEMSGIPGLDMLSGGRTDWSGSDYDMSAARRIFPHRHKGEGHFLALFHSLDGDSDAAKKKAPNGQEPEDELYRAFEHEFLNRTLEGKMRMFGENLYLIPDGIDIDKIRVVRAGLHLGVCRKNRFEPSHALCLALKAQDFINRVDLASDSDDARKYITGDTLRCDKSGWCAVTADGFPLGWGKASGGVLKNHFPKYMRLRG